LLFTSIAFAELIGTFAMRSESVSLRRLGPLTNRSLVGAVALTVALQILLVVLPVTRDLLGLEPLDATHWGFAIALALALALAIALALACLAFVEIDMAILRRAPMHR
jgi:Ca2+-transporting ATPase